jgi:hypothetical protein
MYDRVGSNNSMLPSMIYSYHTGIPILSGLMSRTSLTETENIIQLLNSYKKEKAIEKLLDQKDLFVITTRDALMPDESRLLKHVNQFAENDTLKFGYITKAELFKKKVSADVYTIDGRIKPDTTTIIYLKEEARKPFLPANIMDYEKIYTVDSTAVKTGVYVVSFHYHYTLNTYRALACDLIVNRSNTKNSEWVYTVPVRILSGFYKGFGVFEYRVEIERGNNYEFMLKGFVDQSYHISDFMLRPEALDVELSKEGKEESYNNFPTSAY